MDSLLHDLRYAARTLRRNRGFTAVAVAALALGVGANTAIFSVVDAVVFRPLPYAAPERLVTMNELLQPQGSATRATALDFADWRAQSRSFTDMAAFIGNGFTITGRGDPEFVLGQQVSASLFRVLGARPMLGRTFLPDEDEAGREPSVVLGYEVWRRLFGGDPEIVGRRVTLNGKQHTIVGVMPQHFEFPGARYQLWVPLDLVRQEGWNNRNNHYLQVVARLRPGASLASAQADMRAVAARLAAQYPQTNGNVGVAVGSLTESVVGKVRPALLVLLGAVAFVLLIACANVANLLLARAAARGREMAVRTALGAARGRLVRQVLTESLTLALAGGAAGLALATWGVHALGALIPAEVPRLHEVAIDGRVLAFTLLASLVTGVAFGLAPALGAGTVDLVAGLREGGRGATAGARRHLRDGLVVAEVALSVVLLAGAGLAVRSLMRLGAVDPGFRPQGVMTLGVVLPQARYPSAPEIRAFYQRLLDRLEGGGWADAVAATTHLPLSGQNWVNSVAVEGRAAQRADEDASASIRGVTPGYFRALGTPVRAGRAFTAQDRAGSAPVAIVNEAFARRYWPNENRGALGALGKRVRLGDESSTDPWLEVVGLAADIHHEGLDVDPRAEVYVPFAQFPDWAVMLAGRALVFVVRAPGSEGTVVRQVRGELRALDPALPVINAQPLSALVSASVAEPRFRAALLALFAVLAVTLAAIGIYGVLSGAVAQRTREIGVRMALGATPGQVLRPVVGRGAALVGGGLALGLLGALALTRVMAGLLFDTSPTDAPTLAAVSLVACLAAIPAAWLPARRATRVDPMVALRAE